MVSFFPKDVKTFITVPICGIVQPFSIRAITGCFMPLLLKGINGKFLPTHTDFFAQISTGAFMERKLQYEHLYKRYCADAYNKYAQPQLRHIDIQLSPRA